MTSPSSATQYFFFKFLSLFVLIAKEKTPASGVHTTSDWLTRLCTLTCTDCCLLTADGEKVFNGTCSMGPHWCWVCLQSSRLVQRHCREKLILYCQESIDLLLFQDGLHSLTGSTFIIVVEGVRNNITWYLLSGLINEQQCFISRINPNAWIQTWNLPMSQVKHWSLCATIPSTRCL